MRFEGERAPGSTVSSVRGHLHETRVTIIDPAAPGITPRHLNKHIDYDLDPPPPGTKEKSLAIPQGVAVSADGASLYLAAKGSGKVGVFSTARLEDNSFVPDAANHISLTGGGASGLVLDEANKRLYVTTRFDNGISVVDTVTRTETAHFTMHNPEPVSVTAGRAFLYDTNLSSSNGEASCSSCHINADKGDQIGMGGAEDRFRFRVQMRVGPRYRK